MDQYIHKYTQHIHTTCTHMSWELMRVTIINHIRYITYYLSIQAVLTEKMLNKKIEFLLSKYSNAESKKSGSTAALSSLVKDIVINIEEEKEVKKIKVYKYDGDWKNDLIDILYDEIDRLHASSFNDRPSLLKLIMHIADSSIKFILFYSSFLFTLELKHGDIVADVYKNIVDYEFCHRNDTIFTINMMFLYGTKGNTSAAVVKIFKKFQEKFSDTSSSLLQNYTHVIMITTTILEDLDIDIHYHSLCFLLHDIYKSSNKKNFLNYLKSYFVWKLSATAGGSTNQQLSSRLFKLYTSEYHEVKEVETLLATTLKEYVIQLENEDAAVGKKIENAFNTVKQILSPKIAVYVLYEGAAYISTKVAHRIASLTVIASYIDYEAFIKEMKATTTNNSSDNAAIDDVTINGNSSRVILKLVWQPMLDALMLDTSEVVRIKVLTMIMNFDQVVMTQDVYRVLLRKYNDTSNKVVSLAQEAIENYLGVDWPAAHLAPEEFLLSTKYLWQCFSTVPIEKSSKSSMNFLVAMTRKCLFISGYRELPKDVEGKSSSNDSKTDCTPETEGFEDASTWWLELLETNESAIKSTLEGLNLTDFPPETVNDIINALNVV